MKKATSILLLCCILIISLASCSDKGPQSALTSGSENTSSPLPVLSADTEGDSTNSLPTSETETDTETDPPAVSDTEPITEPVTEPPAPAETRLSVVAAGDNLIHEGIIADAKQADGSYSFISKYDEIADMVSTADIAFINQETPLCGERYGYAGWPRFNSPQELGKDMIDLGFDVLCFANNHMADKMKQNDPELNGRAMTDMMDYTDTLDALILGLYRSFEDYETIRYMNIDGVKIAFLAYTYATNAYWQDKTPADGVYLPIILDRAIKRQLAAARENADFVIVSMHWGTENSHTVNDEQRRLARLLADGGADVVIGTHPHVVQSAEWYDRPDGGRMLCYYSLGNLISNQETFANNIGYIARFDLVIDENGRRVEADSIVPIFNFHDKDKRNAKIYTINHITDDLVAAHYSNSELAVGEAPYTVESVLRIIKENVPAEFLDLSLIN